jgi:hypothetical protein
MATQVNTRTSNNVSPNPTGNAAAFVDTGAIAGAIVRLPDPVSLEQQAKYKQQGLTVTSNNRSIIPRDSAGNIILKENSETNPVLIIEPVATKITTNSILRVIETRFQYFSFPAAVRVNDTEPIILDISDIDTDLGLAVDDVIFARYKPSEDRKVLGLVPGSSANYDGTAEFGSGILMDEIEAGNLQKNTNTYYITPAIKNSGADLRFRVKINHRFDIIPERFWTAQSVVTFAIAKSGPNDPLQRGYTGKVRISMGNWNVRDTLIDVVIRNSEFNIGDNFGITAGADFTNPDDLYFHTINSEQTYWAITDASKNVDEWNQEI